MLLVVVEHDRGVMAAATEDALGFARSLGDDVHALWIGEAADELASQLGARGVAVVHQAHHDLLRDYGPEAWGEVIVQAVQRLAPDAVLATGTDRGNEMLAQAAARLDAPFAANCTAAERNGEWAITRVRWGGSLLEHATLDAPTAILSVALHTFDPAGVAVATATAAQPLIEPFTPELAAELARTLVRDRIERQAGITLATAPVVVGGGRGVGSAEGFAVLEELAGALGGVVGCSRAVTNNGWRNHTDQVGQTGTRIAPDLYIACGISGAIQHWVGAMASKHILAINTDPEANMVVKADSAVIGDLHEVVPAITAELHRRHPR